jgi:hypothetical protein
MKTLSTFLLALVLGAGLQAQTNVHFDSVLTALDTYDNGSDGDTVFVINDIRFPVNYDTAFGGFWAGGFAVSNRTDTADGSFMNLYSAHATPEASNGYMVANLAQGPVTISTNFEITTDRTFNYTSVDVTNTTYAYKSMRDGDMFAKQFGGASGNDPDYFFIRFSNGVVNIDHYLADFRSSNNSEDYIMDEWETVDLTPFQGGMSFTMELFSSDTGAFGINTPLFFAIDNLGFEISGGVGVTEVGNDNLDCWSNPAGIQLRKPANGQLNIYDLAGRLLLTTRLDGLSTIPLPAHRQIILLEHIQGRKRTTTKLLH